MFILAKQIEKHEIEIIKNEVIFQNFYLLFLLRSFKKNLILCSVCQKTFWNNTKILYRLNIH